MKYSGMKLKFSEANPSHKSSLNTGQLLFDDISNHNENLPASQNSQAFGDLNLIETCSITAIPDLDSQINPYDFRINDLNACHTDEVNNQNDEHHIIQLLTNYKFTSIYIPSESIFKQLKSIFSRSCINSKFYGQYSEFIGEKINMCPESDLAEVQFLTASSFQRFIVQGDNTEVPLQQAWKINIDMLQAETNPTLNWESALQSLVKSQNFEVFEEKSKLYVVQTQTLTGN